LQEFYHAASAPPGQPIPSRNREGRLQFGLDDGIVFVLLPGGEAWIGGQHDDPTLPCHDPEASLTESPVHHVTLAPFFIGKHEVTQAQWLQLTGKKPSAIHDKRTPLGGTPITLRHPVESVTWDECQALLERLGLDFPTEAQWEYACRAGTTTTWPTGDTPASLVGFACVPDPLGEDAPRPTHHDPVGSHAPNGFGMHDMVGNVAEWCRDYFSSLAYLLPAASGDGARPVPLMQVRALRGGSFQDPPSEGSSAARNAKPFNHRGEWLGVRAARRLELGR
jgi:formylglycine-generating enzyme required for sulfatase activity